MHQDKLLNAVNPCSEGDKQAFNSGKAVIGRQ